jgi:putative FmdB family regulatory protein
MPIYEYFCNSCETNTETICKVAEKPETIPCADCGKDAESRMSKPSHFRIAIDGNGRKILARSATREQYEHNVGNKPSKEVKEGVAKQSRSVYTKSYQQHVDAQNKHKHAKFMHDFKKKSEK